MHSNATWKPGSTTARFSSIPSQASQGAGVSRISTLELLPRPLTRPGRQPLSQQRAQGLCAWQFRGALLLFSGWAGPPGSIFRPCWPWIFRPRDPTESGNRLCLWDLGHDLLRTSGPGWKASGNGGWIISPRELKVIKRMPLSPPILSSQI